MLGPSSPARASATIRPTLGIAHKAAFDFDTDDDRGEGYRPARRGAGGRSDTSRVLYVILALVFGGAGVHNLAAGRYLRGVAQFCFTCLTVALCFVIVGFFMAPLVALWVLIDIIFVTTDGRGRAFT